jgi:hypothetical protein
VVFQVSLREFIHSPTPLIPLRGETWKTEKNQIVPRETGDPTP